LAFLDGDRRADGRIKHAVTSPVTHSRPLVMHAPGAWCGRLGGDAEGCLFRVHHEVLGLPDCVANTANATSRSRWVRAQQTAAL